MKLPRAIVMRGPEKLTVPGAGPPNFVYDIQGIISTELICLHPGCEGHFHSVPVWYEVQADSEDEALNYALNHLLAARVVDDGEWKDPPVVRVAPLSEDAKMRMLGPSVAPVLFDCGI